jgi:hypothetical protein
MKKKLSLSKDTIKNLTVRSDVKAGGIIAPPVTENRVGGVCYGPPSGYTKALCQM